MGTQHTPTTSSVIHAYLSIIVHMVVYLRVIGGAGVIRYLVKGICLRLGKYALTTVAHNGNRAAARNNAAYIKRFISYYCRVSRRRRCWRKKWAYQWDTTDYVISI